MLLRTRLFRIAARFIAVGGSLSAVAALECEMASGGVTVPPPTPFLVAYPPLIHCRVPLSSWHVNIESPHAPKISALAF
jgi:hypothetical protein